MSNSNVLQAMNIIADRAVNSLKFDKTIIATIVKVENKETGEYRADYESGQFRIYSENGIEYKEGDSVYVTIPEGDYSNKKFITGKAINQTNVDNLVNLANILIYDANKISVITHDNNRWLIPQEAFANGINRYKDKLLKVSADFQGSVTLTNNLIPSYLNPKVYGIRLYYEDNNQQIELAKSNIGDMNGNVLNYSIPTTQSVYFPITEEFQKTIGQIYLELYYETSVQDSDGREITIIQDNGKNLTIDNIQIQFCEQVDFSKDVYYLKINQISKTELKAILYKEGKDISTSAIAYQWYAADAAASSGWTKISEDKGKTATLTVAEEGQQSYKVEAFYEQDKSISQTITINTLENVYITYEYNENKEQYEIQLNGYEVEWHTYRPNGEKLMEPSVTPLLKIPEADIISYAIVRCEYNKAVFTVYIKAPTSSRHISFKTSGELFHYNANSDISAAIANQEYTLSYEYLGTNTVSKVEWQLTGNNITLNATKYNPENSMLRDIWVDATNTVHFSIKDTYAIQNWNNTFRVILTLGDNTTQSALREIYFVKDGQQGTNGTDYCCIVLPTTKDGDILDDSEAILTDTEDIYLSLFAYKQGKRISITNNEVTWKPHYQAGTNLTATEKTEAPWALCQIGHVKNQGTYNYHLITATVNIEGNQLHYNYPINYCTNENQIFVELEMPKFVEYNAAGKSPEWLDKEIMCKAIDEDKKRVPDVWGSSNLISINNNKLIPKAEFNFSRGIGVLQFGDLYCPIMMYLNTFGNEAINGWDGTSIQLDNENNTILAPQIGAGRKDNENKFTGVIMGDDQSINKIGLYGYNAGKLSFGLTEEGNAFFGPNKEIDFNVTNEEYKIGGWIIDQNQLTGGKTTLHSNNGITTNAVNIEASGISGKMGVFTGRDANYQPTTILGISSEDSIVFEVPTNKVIRLSGTAMRSASEILLNAIKVSIYDTTKGKYRIVLDELNDLLSQIQYTNERIDSLMQDVINLQSRVNALENSSSGGGGFTP